MWKMEDLLLSEVLAQAEDKAEALRKKGGIHRSKFAICTDEGSVLRSAKAATAGKQPAGLQQIGLALGVVAVEDINTPIGLPPSGVQIAKPVKGQFTDTQR